MVPRGSWQRSHTALAELVSLSSDTMEASGEGSGVAGVQESAVASGQGVIVFTSEVFWQASPEEDAAPGPTRELSLVSMDERLVYMLSLWSEHKESMSESFCKLMFG